MKDNYPPTSRHETFGSAQAIRAGLSTRFVGQVVYYWPSIGSTNDELKRLAHQGEPEGTLAITDEQLTGRGRLDRTWIAPAGSSLLTSLLFRPTFLAPIRVQQLTMVCSLAVADAVTQVTGLQPVLKWPNDLQLQGKKLAGVLTDLGFREEDGPSKAKLPGTTGLAWVVVGMGLNVNVEFTSRSSTNNWPDLADTAISLAMVLGRPVPRLPLLHSYLREIEARYGALRTGLSPHWEWASRLGTLGQEVRVTTPEGTFQGLAEGVDETGALRLRQPDGQVRSILSGDVTLRV